MESGVVRLLLFGEPRLEMDGQTVALPRRESLLCLLARLLLQPGRPLSRRNLAFALWPDQSEAEALANLRRHLYLVRNLLPPQVRKLLLIASQTVSWQASPLVWVDVTAFEQAGERLEEMERAVEGYRGGLAVGIQGDEFLIARREALRERFLSLLKRLAQGYAERGDLTRALDWVRRLLLEDPWDEEAARLKMTLEAQTGNRAAALATYQTLARELERELNTQPMPETMTLYSDILHNRLMRPSAPPKPAAPLFISREAELEQLSGLFRGLGNGRGGVAFVSGPAGVGKTALLQESLRRLADNATGIAPRVLWGGCSPPVSDSPPRPYAPWGQILNAAAPLLARSEEILPEWLNRLLPLVPDLALLKPGLLAPAHPNAAELRAALRQAFHALALARPLILVLEDVHWADDASLDVLRELADTCSALPLLILITHRLEELPLPLLQVKRALRQRRALVELPLHAFRPAEARSLLKALLREETLPPSLYEELARYAEGLPLLLREAAETIRQARGERPSLPGLRDSIALRLEGLNRAAREMLEAAALLGFSFSDRELQALLGWSEAAQAAALDSLSANRFVTEAILPGAPEYVFSHQLIHEILLEVIPAARAAILHQQVALVLQQVHAGESGFAGRIAAHYQAAGLPLPAARFWLEHARESTDLAAFDAALQAIERAETLLTGDASLEGRELWAQAALQRGVIAHYRGQASDALPLLQEALRLCSDFPPLRAHALARLAYALYTSDRYAEAWQSADESLLLARALADSQAIARALNIRGMAALLLGRHAQSIQDLREALALEESLAQPSAQTVQSLNHLGTALVFVQDYAGADETLAKTVELARRGGLRRLESAALTMQGQIALNCGRYPEAIEIYRQAIEVAGDSYLPGMWGKFAGRGAAYLRMGRLGEAQSDFERGLEIARRVESRYGQLLMRVYLAFTALAAGRTPPDSLAALEKEAAALDLHAVVMLAALFRARLRRLAGDVSQADAIGERALRAAQASGVPQFIQNARLEWLFAQAQTGATDQALLDTLSRQAGEFGETPQQILVKLTRAALLRAENRLPEALAAAEEALSLARACPDAILTGEALLLRMSIHQAAGQCAAAPTCRADLLSLAETAFAPFQLMFNQPSDEILREIVLRNA
ncbi:MAG: AAA family ATPase [Anaerolineales bacterium]|nr:AAA family ATPase [Anaerolineales bacterium]